MNKNMLIALCLGMSFGGLFGMKKEVSGWRTFSYKPFGNNQVVKKFLIKSDNNGCFIKNGTYEKEDDKSQNVFVTEGKFEVIKEVVSEGVAYRLIHVFDSKGSCSEKFLKASKSGLESFEDEQMQKTLHNTLKEFFIFVNTAKKLIEENNN